jgi:fibronectin-binding autotransporter adhesin
VLFGYFPISSLQEQIAMIRIKLVFLCLGLVALTSFANAADYTFDINSGNWSDGTLWTSTTPGTIPADGSTVDITSGYTATIDVNTNNINGLSLKNGSTINQSANIFTGQGAWNIGQGDATVGTWNLSGGTINKSCSVNGDALILGRDGGTGSLIMTNSAVVNVTGDEVIVGEGNGTTDSQGILEMHDYSQLNFTTGGLTQSTNFYVGRWASTGTMTMTGHAIFTNSRAGGANVIGGGWGWGGGVGGHGTLTMTGSSQFIANSREIWIGQGTSGARDSEGNVTLSDNASMSVLGNWFIVGRDGGTGTLTVNGGTVTRSGGGYFALGVWGDSTNESTGTINLNGGTILCGGDLVLGFSTGSKANFNLNGGTVQASYVGSNYWGGTAAVSNLNFNGGILQPSGPSGNFVGSTVTLNVQTNGAKIDTNNFDITINKAFTPDATYTGGGLTKLGSGKLTLRAANTYTGATTVSGGSLILNATSDVNTSSGITINGTGAKFIQNNASTAVTPTVTVTNGTLDGTGTVNTVVVGNSATNVIAHGDSGTGSLTIGSLTFSGSATVAFNPIDQYTPGINTTTITTNGVKNIKVNATRTTWDPVTYNLMSYTGAIGGSGFGAFDLGTITGLSTRQSPTLLNPDGYIAVQITGANPVWTGAYNSNWTTATIPDPFNWSATTGDPQFLAGDTVIFDDTASNTSVDIYDADVAPTRAIFSNNYNNYVVDSTNTTPHGINGAGSVLINGANSAGSVSIKNANTYTGGTTINSGTLKINNANALGTGALTINGGTIDNGTTGSIAIANTANVNGDFTFGGSQDLSLNDVNLATTRTITTNDLYSAGTKLTVSGVISGGTNVGFNKAGAGTMVLSGNNTYTGETHVNDGVLSITGGTTGVSTANIRVQPTGTATLDISGGTVNANLLDVGDYTTGTAIMNMSGTSSLTTAGEVWIGQASGSNGTINLSGNASITSNSWFCVGRDSGTGVFNMNGGTVNKLGGGNFIVGSLGGTGTVYLNKGTINNNASLILGENSSTGPANATFYLGDNSGNAAVVQARTVETWGTSLGTLYFNGGTLQATADSTNYIVGVANLYVQTGGAKIDTNGHNITIASGLWSGTSPDGGLTKVGSGNLTLSGNNYYTGPTVVSNGSLIINTGTIYETSPVSINGSGAKLIYANATYPLMSPVTVTTGTLDAIGTVNTVTVADGTGGIITNGNGTSTALTIGTSLTFNGVGTMTLNTATANTTTADTVLKITGALTANGAADSITVNAVAPLWNTGSTYYLANYGSLVGSTSAFKMGEITGLTPRQFATLGTPTGYITLNITGADNIKWTGAQNSDWTTATIPDPYNWSVTSGDPQFLTGDSVLFNDDATRVTVDITENVNPTGVTFNNNSKDYTISSTGGFGITSGTLIKSGTGAVTITTANTYAVGTTLNAGKLNINNASAIGTGALTINGGTLDNTSGAAIILSTNNAQYWNADFTFGGTKDLNLGTGAVTLSASVSPVITTNGSAKLTVGGVVGGTTGITKAGSGTLVLNGANTYAGSTNINAGKVIVGNNTALGASTGGAVTISDGATLDTNGQNISTKSISVQGSGVGGAGAIINTGIRQINTVQDVTLTGDTTFGGTYSSGDGGRWDIRSAAAATSTLSTGGNAYKLTKVGNNMVGLVNTVVDPALADITIQSGILSFEGTTTGTGNESTPITVQAGGTLSFGWDYAGSTSHAVTLDGGRFHVVNQSLTYNGAIDVTSAGGAVSAGSAVNDEGATTASLTLPGNVTVTGGGLLTKQGAGAVTIDGVLNSAGDVTISNGLLQINTAGASTAGDISGSATSTLGIGTAISNTTLTASSVVVNTLTIGAGSKLVINPIPGGSLAGASIKAVPEPSTLVLLAIAAMVGLVSVWRRK